jgi:hypothetical protein
LSLLDESIPPPKDAFENSISDEGIIDPPKPTPVLLLALPCPPPFY